MILCRHLARKLLFAIGSTILSTFSGTIMNYATRSYPTDLPALNDRSLIRHSIILGDGESSDQLVLRNDLINYLTGNIQNRIIALKPKHSYHLNKGNPVPILQITLHPDISTKHKYMTFLLSNNIKELTRCCMALHLGMSEKLREPCWHGYVSQAEAASRAKNATYLSECSKLVTPMMK